MCTVLAPTLHMYRVHTTVYTLHAHCTQPCTAVEVLTGGLGCGHYTLTLLNLGVGTHAASNSCLRPSRAGSNVFVLLFVCIPLLVCCCCCFFFCLVRRKRRRKALRRAKQRALQKDFSAILHVRDEEAQLWWDKEPIHAAEPGKFDPSADTALPVKRYPSSNASRRTPSFTLLTPSEPRVLSLQSKPPRPRVSSTKRSQTVPTLEGWPVWMVKAPDIAEGETIAVAAAKGSLGRPRGAAARAAAKVAAMEAAARAATATLAVAPVLAAVLKVSEGPDPDPDPDPNPDQMSGEAKPPSPGRASSGSPEPSRSPRDAEQSAESACLGGATAPQFATLVPLWPLGKQGSGLGCSTHSQGAP